MEQKTKPLDLKTGFYDYHFFNQRLREERRRTERTQSPFSLLALDFSYLFDKHPKLKMKSVKKLIAEIVRENT